MTVGEKIPAASRPGAGVLMLIVFASVVLPNIPGLGLLLAPLMSFTTAVHEMGHALACVLTGGQVSGMSIVADNAGHAGLTFCRGGIPFVYAQAGYLGTAVVGSLLIALGRFHRLSKPILFLIGTGFGISSLIFMGATIFTGQILAGIGSLVIGLSIAAAIIWTSLRLNYYYANLVLLFLGVQCGLNAIADDINLLLQTFGLHPAAWSDATGMQQMTGIPAPVWAFVWTVMALFILGMTIRWTYFGKSKALPGTTV